MQVEEGKVEEAFMLNSKRSSFHVIYFMLYSHRDKILKMKENEQNNTRAN